MSIGGGIGIYYSPNNTMTNNMFSGATNYDFLIEGDTLADYTPDIDTTNTVDG